MHVARLVSRDVSTVVGREDGLYLRGKALEVLSLKKTRPTYLASGSEALCRRGHEQVLIVDGIRETPQALGKNNGDQKWDDHKAELISIQKEPGMNVK